MAERAVLAGCLRAALAGRRQVVLVAGEPGVGKTRLAEEAVALGRELGVACALGRASEDEGSPPYWPFLQVFRGLGAGAAPAGLTGGSGAARERFRLFEETAAALVAAAEPGGLLVVLDDLQWADAATVRLLVHLAAGVPPARLMVVATYRDTETGQGPLRDALAALAREAAVTRIRLDGLARAEVGAQLAAVTGWAVPESVTAAVWRRTGGNPFFVGELGRLLRSSADGQLPDGVRDAVRDRLGRLSPRCRRVLVAAAVLGSGVDPVAVAAVTGTELAAVLAALDEAAAAGILTDPPERRFGHDLLREAARLAVPSADRSALHRGMAEHLAARRDSDDRVAEIAYHWLESLPAGDAAQAVAWAGRAADRAMAQLAWEEAAALYGRALAAGERHGVLAPPDRTRLLLAQARAQVRAFNLDDARRSLTAAVDLARAAGDVDSLAAAALTMEGVNDVAWEPTSRVLCAEVLDRLPDGDSALRARLLALLVTAAGWAVPRAAAADTSARALAMAERVGDRHALREALRARQLALSGPDGAAERLALGDRLLALRADGDDDAALWGLLWRFDALAQLGDLDGAEAEVERIDAVAARLRSPVGAWHVARARAAVAAARGRFEEALAHARDTDLAASRAGTTGARIPSQGLLLMLRSQVGTLDRSAFDPGGPHPDAAVPGFSRALYATWLLAQGRREEAHRMYRALPPPAELPPFLHLSAYAAMTELAAEFDDRAAAAELYRLQLPHAELFVCSGAGVLIILGPVTYPLGVAAATLGRLDDAARHLRAAIAAGERVGMPPAVAQASHQLARVLARRTRPGDRDEAAALATTAAALAGRLGMHPLQQKAHELAGSLRGGGAPDRLTRREREIAALVAQGLSNRHIAAATHISERTVESHVQHILDKLGCANRTQVAARFRTGSP